MLSSYLPVSKYIRDIFILCSIIFFNSPKIILGQKSIPVDSVDILLSKEINSSVAYLKKNKKSKELLNLDSIFNSSYYKSADKILVLQSLHKMKQKSCRSYPDNYNFLNAAASFAFKDINYSSFKSWLSAYAKILSLKKTKIVQISHLNRSSFLLNYDNLLFKSNTIKWQTDNINNIKYYLEADKLLVKLDMIDLLCSSKNDSYTIHKTKGVLNILDKQWTGQGGKLHWKKTKTDSLNNEFAEIKSYHFNLVRSSCETDSAYYSNTNLFGSKRNIGKLKLKLNHSKSAKKSIYPQFYSYESDLKIDKLYPGLVYKGAIVKKGFKLEGKSINDSIGEIIIKRKNKAFYKIQSSYFALAKNSVHSNKSKMYMFIDSTYIYHPGLDFKYQLKTNTVELTRSGRGMSKSPFINNYHKILMSFTKMKWIIGEDFVHMGKNKTESSNSSYYESLNYFSSQRYRKYQGMDDVNPLLALKKCSKMYGSKIIDCVDYANYLRKPASMIRQQVIGLSFDGFVLYDSATDQITIQDRLLDYIKSSVGKKDYDALYFTCTTEKGEDDAVFHVDNKNLVFFGVSRIDVSRAQTVYIFPKNQRMTMKKNRDIKFDGRCSAGLFFFYGKDFDFNYDNYEINLTKVDSIRIHMVDEELAKFGKTKIKTIQTTIQNCTGDIVINQKDNKSGKKDLPDYPMFKSRRNSYVYYDLGPKYKKGDVKFVIEPYEIKGINKLDTKKIKLGGKFHSAGILPVISDTLKLMKDNTLGFEFYTPPEGITIYEKGVFHDSIYLDHDGLRGKGKIDLLATHVESDEFHFLPNKASCLAREYSIKKDQVGNMPYLVGKDLKTTWYPKAGSTVLENTKSKFLLYNNDIEFDGIIKLAQDSILAAGKMNMYDSELKSDLFYLNSTKFFTDKAQFSLVDSTKIFKIISTENTNVDFNTEDMTADFYLKSNNLKTKLGINKYLVENIGFRWNINERSIEFGDLKKKEIFQKYFDQQNDSLTQYNGSFVSLKSNQNFIGFGSSNASYNLDSYVLDAKFVNQFKVADVNIIPQNGDMRIEKNGIIKSLDSARIVIDTINQFHKLYDASVKIKSKDSYAAKAKIDYWSNAKHVLNVDTVMVDSLSKTYGEASVKLDQMFYLSDDFRFFGKANFKSDDSLFFFKGFSKLTHSAGEHNYKWFRIKTKIDSKKVIIPFDSVLLSHSKQRLFSNIYLCRDSTHMYGTFLNSRKFYKDNPMLNLDRFLSYDTINQSYIISSEKYINNKDSVDDYLQFFPESKKIKAYGELDFGVPTDAVKQRAVGTVEYDMSKRKAIFSTMFGLDFFLDKNAMKMLVEKFNAAKLEDYKINKERFSRDMHYIFGAKKAKKLTSIIDSTNFGQKFTKEFKHTMFFNNVDWIWNQNDKSYQSLGEVALANIGSNYLNKKIKAKIEIRKKSSGNILNLYLTFDNYNWLYLRYHHGVMFVLSSYDEFNKLVSNMKFKDRKSKSKKSKFTYSFNIATNEMLSKFLRRVGDL
ncbi:MAG: hypothetical protein N4A49_15570 [Marinifilaceae bacterium]|jgi:hypothetical protein|nr:hypothetical protein [Marinifilaceae bacterium]